MKGQDVLALYYTSREVLWARAFTCVQGQEHRHRQGGSGVLLQASVFHFRMPRLHSFVFVFIMILCRSREIQHLCKVIVVKDQLKLLYARALPPFKSRLLYRCKLVSAYQQHSLVGGLKLENAQERPWLPKLKIPRFLSLCLSSFHKNISQITGHV